jgi:hypothetical protein
MIITYTSGIENPTKSALNADCLFVSRFSKRDTTLSRNGLSNQKYQ